MPRTPRSSKLTLLSNEPLPTTEVVWSAPRDVLVLGVDPGMASGWALVTPGTRPLLVASGCIRNCERDELNVITRLGPIILAADAYKPGIDFVVALEDMPASQFKHRQAGEALAVSRARWKAALESTLRVAGWVPMLPARWRRIIGLYEHVNLLAPIVDKKTGEERRDWKLAARSWVRQTHGTILRNDNQADAVCVACATAIALEHGEVRLDNGRGRWNPPKPSRKRRA